MTKQAIESGDLRVVFQSRGDRHGHSIERRVDGEWRLVLESIEGSPDEDWPASPALQSLHIEHRPNAPVALLVGKAGTSHWSASVEPFNSQHSLQFDIACRLQQPPQRLGSAYRVAGSRSHRIVQVSATSRETACELVEQPENGQWQVRPATVTSDYPSTIRWRYRISAPQCAD
jgi:hypothetical protein